MIVLSFLVLISGLALAFFFTATTERSAARSFADSATVRDLGNTALQVVMAQILDATAGGQPGSDGKPDASKPLAWASQPGMIRTFDTSGSPFRYHKLYSSTNSAVPTFTLSDDLPPANWRDTPALWSDLNAPVADSLGTLSYPILDPSAATPSATVAATGFAISSPPGYSGSNASAINNPAPMPVRWLYQLKDGSLVAASASGTTVTVAGAKTDNPIVGRVAYWTDDETCKINVNTAAEGTYWDTPRFKGPGWAGVFSSGTVNDSIARSYPDLSYAAYQPAAFEFQRYPGHPAQVALSTIFPAITTQLAAGVTPRIVWGGSKGGTIWTGTSTIDLTQAPRKAPYASLDEFQFSGTATLPRTNNSAGNSTLTKSDLEAAKFFLTASSRAPEVNLFNLPRIACWPVDKSLATDPSSARTTAYDRLIAFCSTLRKDLGTGAYRYFFQRGNPQSPTEDYEGIQRNRDLYAYLQFLTKSPIPGFGGTFTAKYPQDRDQILTEIFDYIRCTNLMDPALGGYPITLAATAGGAWPATTNQFVQARKTPSDGNGTHLLGSGQVMPIRIGSTVGFGRFPSLKELGMAFVCVATGELPDTSSITNAATLATYLADTAKPINDEIIKLISNIPSAGGTGIPAAAPTTVSAYLQANAGAWTQVRNKWLASVKTGLDTPLTTFAQGSLTYCNPALNAAALAPTERRVQMVVMERLFSPMAGNAPLYPDLIIQLQGLGSLTISNAANIVTGSLFSTSPTLAGWLLKVSCFSASSTLGSNPLNTDALFASNCATAVAPTSSATGYSKFPYYPFISQPFTVDGNTMSFAGGTLTHSLFQGNYAYDQQNSVLDSKFKCAGAPALTAVTSNTSNLVQNATITFPSGTFPTPTFPSYTNSGIYPWGGNATTGFYWQVRDWLPQATCLKSPSDIMKYATVRSMTFNGDGRLAALTTNILDTSFTTYPDYNSSTAIGTNNLCYTSPGSSSAYSRIGGSASQTYNTRQVPPGTAVTSGDFDIIARTAPGPFVNKPDEGDATTNRCPYIDVDQNASNAKIYTPNRIMPSPGMFGSLPSGVKAGQHWQTLLFRPQPSHPQSVQSRPGQPPDHLLMDLFWMPMVEPYAISEPFSTAGKVNMNYQILPFTYINRPTALIGAMKVEMVTTVPSGTATATDEIPDDPKNATQPWRRTLNLSETNGTLRQFREKFATGEIFRSASEICDIYLTPSDQNWTSDTAAQTFWSANLNTADNLREKPYANLYARLTTKSNTYTVHIRAQALQKVPGTPADQWVEGRDRVAAEERSSVMIERYIDVEDSSLPDFATDSTALLSDHCQMRVLSTKRFNP